MACLVPQVQSGKNTSNRKFKRMTLRLSAIVAAAMATMSAHDAKAVTLWNGGTFNQVGVANNAGLAGRFFNLAPINLNNRDTNLDVTNFATFTAVVNNSTPATLAAPNLGATIAYSNVNFPNSGGSAFGSVGFTPADNNRTMWVGTLNVPALEAGNTPISVNSDDGSVVWIDGVQVVNRNANGGFGGDPGTTASINLSAGAHEIVVSQYEGGGGAGVVLRYDPVGAEALQIIPVARPGPVQILSGPQATAAVINDTVTLSASTTLASTNLLNVQVNGQLTADLAANPNITLTNAGATYSFNSTTFTGAGNLTITPQNSVLSDVRLGRVLDGGFSGVNITKTGVNNLILDHTAAAADADGITYHVQGGSLLVQGSAATNPLGAATIELEAPVGTTVNSRLILGSTAGNVTFNNNILVEDNATIYAKRLDLDSGVGNGAVTVTLGGAGINLPAAKTLTLGGDLTGGVGGDTYTLAFNKALSGSGNLILQLGTVTTNANHTHSGTTTIQDGVLVLNNLANFTNSAITVGAGGNTDVLRVELGANANATTLASLALSTAGNTGQFEAQRGIINITGNITDAGGTSRINMNGGPGGSNVAINVLGGSTAVDILDWDYGTLTSTNLTVNTTLSIRNVTVSSNNVVLNGNMDFEAASNGTGVIGDAGTDVLNLNGGTRTFTINNGTAAVDTRIDSIIQNGGITKAGVGVLQLNNANTFAGVTTINAGDLIASASGALGTAAGGTTINAGARLVATGGIDLGNENISLANALPNAIINQAGNNRIGGTLTQTNAAALTTGLQSIDGQLSIDGNVTLANSGLEVSGAGDVVLNGTISQNAVAATRNTFRQRLYDLPQNNNDIRGVSGGTVQTVINTAADVTNYFTGHLNHNDSTINTEAGFDINGPAGNFAGVWTTNFTPNETGGWIFRNLGNVDDNAGYWLDINQDGAFSTAERFAERGCCGTLTAAPVAVTAGQTYLLAFAMNDTGGGGSFLDLEFARPSAAATFIDLNPTGAGNAGLFTQSVNSLTKTGAGKLTLNGVANFAQGVVVTGGTLAVNSTLTAPTVAFGAGTTYAGIGTINAATLTLTDATLAPGNSPGASVLNGDEIWIGNMDYNWQIHNATSTPGVGWDFHQITGTLDLTGLTQAEINLWSLSSILPDVSGLALNFNLANDFVFPILTADGGILGFDPSDFIIRLTPNNGTAGFANPIEDGFFFLSQNGNTLFLNFQTGVPEPATLSLLAMGGLGLLRRRRRER